jgi:hypothetical protein
MKPKAPAIAIRRHEAALAAFRNKIAVLERLLTDCKLEKAPARLSVSAFTAWEDAELGIIALSRSVVYSNDAVYIELRKNMEHLLERVAQRKVRSNRRQNSEEVLKRRLADVEESAQSFVNQYSAARAELLEVRQDNVRLREKLKRLSEFTPNVVALVPRARELDTSDTDNSEKT